jgi:hypothetical protein
MMGIWLSDKDSEFDRRSETSGIRISVRSFERLGVDDCKWRLAFGFNGVQERNLT